mgnify:CR=1 FL=1
MIMGTITCEKCGMMMRDEKRTRKEMKLHQAECDGHDNPYDRFATGDIVELSAFGRQRLGHEPAVYEVVSLNTDSDHTVRVRDVITGNTKTYAHSFLIKVDKK